MRGLDRKVDVERFSHIQDGTGQEVEAWSKIITRRWANVRPLAGDERYTAAQFVARQQTEFRLRWADDAAEITPLDRIIYPAGATPEPSDIYDIIEVSELGRRDALRIIAARRTE